MTPDEPAGTAAGPSPQHPGPAPLDPRVARSRSAVLAATLELLVERGMPAVSIEAISERSGVAKTTVYRHWPTREALLADAWATMRVEEPPLLTGQLHDDVRAHLMALARRLDRPPFSVLLPDLLAAAERDETMRHLHHHLLASRPRPVTHRLDEAVAAGELPAGTDTDFLAVLLVSPLFHRRLLERSRVPPAFIDRVVTTVLAAAGAGLATREPKGSRRTRRSRP